MKFGTWIPNCRDLATPEIIRRTAVRAEQLGYDSVFVSDHVVVPNAYVDRFGAGRTSRPIWPSSSTGGE